MTETAKQICSCGYSWNPEDWEALLAGCPQCRGTHMKTITLIEEARRLAKDLHLDNHDFEVYLLPALRRVKQIGFEEGKNDALS